MSVPGPLDLSRPLDGDLTGMRLGLSVDLGCWAVDPEIAAAVDGRGRRASRPPAPTVEEVDPAFAGADEEAWMRAVGACSWPPTTATCSTSSASAWTRTWSRLIEAGRQVSAPSTYKRIELVRTDLWRRLAPILADHDALLCPTMAVPPVAGRQGRRPAAPPDDADGYHSPDMTAVFNLVSPCPAISVPCGQPRRAAHAGLPIGLQIVGRRWREDIVLRIARAVELDDAVLIADSASSSSGRRRGDRRRSGVAQPTSRPARRARPAARRASRSTQSATRGVGPLGVERTRPRSAPSSTVRMPAGAPASTSLSSRSPT